MAASCEGIMLSCVCHPMINNEASLLIVGVFYSK
jgi:hypothetical protein